MRDTYAQRPDNTSERGTAFYSNGYGQRSRHERDAATSAGVVYYPAFGFYAFGASCGCDTLTYSSGGCGAGGAPCAVASTGPDGIHDGGADGQLKRLTSMQGVHAG